ncbi:uncharacterized protein LOC128736883 [Sabethes cyaneus]|uniref:uncharacterized protein LOC128736883 n=1 Tax=Sabethes cyaneus TaxID=53552 RepID=UPI00237EAEC8|nr:uncharacterized protein LOC128736883 [Sabethes cyaneus]
MYEHFMASAMRYFVGRGNRIRTGYIKRFFHDEFTQPERIAGHKQTEKNRTLELPSAGSIANKYQIFRDIDATVILDIEEERQRKMPVKDSNESVHKLPGVYSELNLNRGQTEVYDIEDLITVLRLNNAGNIFVCSVPKEIKYVDYICVVTGMSFRHMRGIVEFVRKVYKMKRKPDEIIPKIEGENSADWMAIDLGNIVLHVFSEKAREQYNLESLWALGPEYDSNCNEPEESLNELIERHTIYLDDLKPLKVT